MDDLDESKPARTLNRTVHYYTDPTIPARVGRIVAHLERTGLGCPVQRSGVMREALRRGLNALETAPRLPAPPASAVKVAMRVDAALWSKTATLATRFEDRRDVVLGHALALGVAHLEREASGQ